MNITDTLQAAGFSPGAVQAKAELLERAGAALDVTGAAQEDVRRYVVPGRIEVLGKHTDYAGGRSLLCAAERAITLVATPRTDNVVRVTRAETKETVTATLAGNADVPTGHWSLFPATVARRLARDFPNLLGADIALASDLPIAAGLSSSSALITGLATALMDRNGLTERADFVAAVKTREDLCGYLGAVENGYAFGTLAGDKGIGTAGGSEDHTAILCCKPGRLLRCTFLPVKFERDVPMPVDHVFAVGVSGIVADKTGNALEKYNRASKMAKTLLERWRKEMNRTDVSLGAALASSRGAADRLAWHVQRDWDAQVLLKRLRQFRLECDEIIPGVAAALYSKSLSELGPLVDRSQTLAEEALENQVPETIALQRGARELGAVAASAFGAGFGGSVWALVPVNGAEEFAEKWQDHYATKFPRLAPKAQFFLTPAGPGLLKL